MEVKYKIKSEIKLKESIIQVSESLKIEIIQAIQSFPIAESRDEKASLFFLNTESSWLGLLTLAIRRVNERASFLQELTIYNKEEHFGRPDLLISVPQKNDGYRHYLIEAKCREWKCPKNWTVNNTNDNFMHIYDQALSYSKEMFVSFNDFDPKIICLSFDWIRKGKQGSNSRIHEATKYFNNLNIDNSAIDFLSFYNTDVDGLLVHGKIGDPKI